MQPENRCPDVFIEHRIRYETCVDVENGERRAAWRKAAVSGLSMVSHADSRDSPQNSELLELTVTCDCDRSWGSDHG